MMTIVKENAYLVVKNRNKMKRATLFLALAAVVACRQAVVPETPGDLPEGISVEVQTDWLYSRGERISLLARLQSDRDTTVRLDLTLVPDTCLMTTKAPCYGSSHKVRLRKGEKQVKIRIPGQEPGFYQVNLTGAKPFNIGVDPERIPCEQNKPSDFDAFWEETLQELATVPMEPVLTPLEEASGHARKLYRVEMKSFGGALMGGYLAVPVAEGKFPARIDFMGYGAEPYLYGADDNPNLIQFLVSVRGQGIFKEPEGRWIDRGLDGKENFYYRGAYCDAVRAVDFIASLDRTDPDRIFACGDSQAGALTWISASLNHKLRAVAPSVPFMSDFPDYWKIVWWPVWEVFETADAEGISRDDLFMLLSYFDVKNFTDRITCPVRMAFGLQDPTCPPHTNFSGYNQVRSEKSWFCVPTCGHDMWREADWDRERDTFFAGF